MKKNILFSILAWLFILSLDAQSYVDLKLRMTDPAEHSIIYTMKKFTFKATITNIGLTPLTVNDTLAVYLLADNDSVFFINAGQIDNFALFPNVAINVNDSCLLSKDMIFTQSFADKNMEICLLAKPINRKTKAISDTLLSDNKSCAAVHIVANMGFANRLTNDYHIILFPNPANDYLLISDIDQIENLCITDLSGRIMPLNFDGSGKVDCSSWAEGVYMVGGTGQGSQKIVIIRR